MRRAIHKDTSYVRISVYKLIVGYATDRTAECPGGKTGTGWAPSNPRSCTSIQAPQP